MDPIRAFVAANPRQKGRVCWVCSLTQEVTDSAGKKHRLVDLINRARTQEPPVLVPEIVRFLVHAGIDPTLPIEGRIGIHYQRSHHLRGER